MAHRNDTVSPCAPSVNGEALSPQYGLFGPRQRTIEGRWEPLRARPSPEPSVRVADERTGDLWDGHGQQNLQGLTRPKGGLETEGDNVVWPPLGDLAAAPANARSSLRRSLSQRLRVASMATPGEAGRRLFRASEELARCGVAALPGEGVVAVRSNGRSRHLSGVLYCGRHLCPSCGGFAAARRREALEDVVPRVANQGRHVHAVFTLRHRAGVRWRDLRDVQKTIWRGMVQTKEWRGAVLGFVRADETTFGRNGHHFHVHALITLAPNVDAESFQRWIESYWRRRARAEGRTAEWADGWWSEVAPDALLSVVRYGTKSAESPAASQLGHVVMAEVLGGSGKRGAAPWSLPPLAFAEVWFESKRHRWFAVGGIWRSEAAAAVETEEGAAAERETHGVPIATVTREVWRALPRETKQWVIGLVANRELTDADVVRQLVWLVEASGPPDAIAA